MTFLAISYHEVGRVKEVHSRTPNGTRVVYTEQIASLVVDFHYLHIRIKYNKTFGAILYYLV